MFRSMVIFSFFRLGDALEEVSAFLFAMSNLNHLSLRPSFLSLDFHLGFQFGRRPAYAATMQSSMPSYGHSYMPPMQPAGMGMSGAMGASAPAWGAGAGAGAGGPPGGGLLDSVVSTLRAEKVLSENQLAQIGLSAANLKRSGIEFDRYLTNQVFVGNVHEIISLPREFFVLKCTMTTR